MHLDRFTKAVLLVIAILLGVMVIHPMLQPAPVRAQAQSEDIPLLMPPIVIIGKRMTPEEKMAFTQQQQQQRIQAMKKVVRKKAESSSSPALSAALKKNGQTAVPVPFKMATT